MLNALSHYGTLFQSGDIFTLPNLQNEQAGLKDCEKNWFLGVIIDCHFKKLSTFINGHPIPVPIKHRGRDNSCIWDYIIMSTWETTVIGEWKETFRKNWYIM